MKEKIREIYINGSPNAFHLKNVWRYLPYAYLSYKNPESAVRYYCQNAVCLSLHLGNENNYFAMNGAQVHAVSSVGFVQPSRHWTLQDECKQSVSPTCSHVITLQKISTQETLTEVPSVYVKSKDNDTVSNTCSTQRKSILYGTESSDVLRSHWHLHSLYISNLALWRHNSVPTD